MTKKLKAKAFVELLNEIRLDEVNFLMASNLKLKIILDVCCLNENEFLMIFCDFSLLEIKPSKKHTLLTFDLGYLNEYKLNLTPEQINTVNKMVYTAITKDDND